MDGRGRRLRRDFRVGDGAEPVLEAREGPARARQVARPHGLADFLYVLAAAAGHDLAQDAFKLVAATLHLW